MRARNRPKWAALFRRQREEWRALNAAQSTAYSRLRYFLKHRGHDPQAGGKAGLKETTAEALRAVFGRDNPHGALSRKHQAERTRTGAGDPAANGGAMRQINKGYQKELGQLTDASSARKRRALQNGTAGKARSGRAPSRKGRDLEQSTDGNQAGREG